MNDGLRTQIAKLQEELAAATIWNQEELKLSLETARHENTALTKKIQQMSGEKTRGAQLEIEHKKKVGELETELGRQAGINKGLSKEIDDLTAKLADSSRSSLAHKQTASESELGIQNLQDRVSQLTKDLRARTQELNETKKHAQELEESEASALARLSRMKQDASKMQNLQQILTERENGM